MTNLCSPSTMCGPFCSVPAVPTITFVVPDAIRSRTSAHVRSSMNTESGGLPDGAVAGASAGRCAPAVITQQSRGDKSDDNIGAISSWRIACTLRLVMMPRAPSVRMACDARASAPALSISRRLRIVGAADPRSRHAPAARIRRLRPIRRNASNGSTCSRAGIFPGAADRCSSCRSRAGSSPRAIRSMTSCTDRRGSTTCTSRSCSTARRS